MEVSILTSNSQPSTVSILGIGIVPIPTKNTTDLTLAACCKLSTSCSKSVKVTLVATDIYRLSASCWKNLHQTCGWKVLTINLQQACWQLAADLLSSSRSKRCERILISAWWQQGKLTLQTCCNLLQQNCCNLRASNCVSDQINTRKNVRFQILSSAKKRKSNISTRFFRNPQWQM